MTEKNIRMEILAQRWLKGEITDEEKLEFEQWYNSFDDTYTIVESDDNRDQLKTRLYSSILKKANIPATQAKEYTLWRRMLVAASVLLVLAMGDWILLHKQASHTFAVAKNNIVPGSNKAVLTLANGKKIVLNDAKNGVLVRQGVVNINKIADGQLAYNGKDQTLPTSAENMLETPRGGQYHLVLSDGTQVWLNAASSIRFPVSFTSSKREVTITGEVYFEVAKDKAHPFVVNAGEQTVEVLGTHFNINSYADEPYLCTTLLEGSVKVTNTATGQTGLLKPGQESLFTANRLLVREADTEEAVAWKNGYFMFGDENINSIMRKMSRWYDVDISYNGPMPEDKFEGTVNRFASVQQVLKKLELTERVHFKIEERRIIVSK